MIIKEFVEVGKPNRPQSRLVPRFVTIHNTSNTGRGADARAHSRFVRNTGYYMLGQRKNWVSWHFTVDDKLAIQHLPVSERGYHAGPGNSQSIGIEICMHQGIDQEAAYDRAAELVGFLLRDLGLQADAVRTHHSWTGKHCPTLLLGSTAWAAFTQRVQAAYGVQADAPIVDPRELETAHDESDASDDPAGNEFDIDHDALRIPPEELSIPQ